MTEHHGPPKEVEGRTPHHQGRPSTSRFSSSHTAYTRGHRTAEEPGIPGKELVWVPCTWTYLQDLTSQLERRREAARRLPPMCDRCGARDLLVCRCGEPDPPLSERDLDAWRATAAHLLALGLFPPIPVHVRRAFWRRGGSDRELAQRLHQGCEGAAA